MDGPSAIPTEAARLLAVQLLSPAFPTGAFAYAQGLEYAMDRGAVGDGAALAGWLADVLEYGAGWSDAVILSLALRPGADHAALDELARALCLTSERLTETLEQGAAFARVAAPLTGAEAAPAALPVAVGRALAGLGLPRAEIIGLYLHGQALNLIQAAVRFMPLGQAEGQRILASLSPVILRLAAGAAEAGEDDLGGCAIGAEMAQARHETMTVRIFRT
ncbi:MAG TPA: urease accessory UreF family protein [Paracoccus sp. (in: a-proteobacteria)]|uniref:urease accessory protein UreF n=1 Tax=uncultured Paracoccus sp. TaxID=189685 RepID=UPI002623F37E|nr:urease accessory UreF family protein [uncultured Paracoccus sp.]HMQ41730.1 urease accessory UreF family protein [Paracoccus sp. (in: a-proteobacteria)]HMR36421.1 urease accessory UreF family protein [Paracoccus sp. (in: a-proteobacteria)]